jgi:hypothetical protein
VPREGTGVGPQAKTEYLAQMRDRYVRAKGRKEKSRLLAEAVSITGYHRKAVIRAWRRPERLGPRPRPRGRTRRYGPAVIRALTAIWEAAGYPWSARLKALVPLWLPWARKRLSLATATEAGLRAIRGIQFTRGRPYKKDDNAHIEQKNWTHVRKHMGYLRYDTMAAVRR